MMHGRGRRHDFEVKVSPIGVGRGQFVRSQTVPSPLRTPAENKLYRAIIDAIDSR